MMANTRTGSRTSLFFSSRSTDFCGEQPRWPNKFIERFSLLARVLIMEKVVETERDELMTRWTLIRKVCHAECDEESWREFYHIYQKLI